MVVNRSFTNSGLTRAAFGMWCHHPASASKRLVRRVRSCWRLVRVPPSPPKLNDVERDESKPRFWNSSTLYSNIIEDAVDRSGSDG